MYSISKISVIIWILFQKVIMHRILLLLLFSCLFLGGPTCYAQISKIDSLKSVALNSSDSLKTKIWFTIAKRYKTYNNDSAIYYGNKALNNALLFKNSNTAIEVMIILAHINLSIGENEKSKALYNRAKQTCIKESNYYLLASIYIDLGRQLYNSSNYAGALNSLDTALRIITDHNIYQLKSNVNNQIGYIYYMIRDLVVAKHYAKLAITSSEKEVNKTNYINDLLLLGRIFLQNKSYDSSLYYYNNALTLSKKTNNIKLTQQAYRKISEYYMNRKEYNYSNQYADSSINYCIQLNMINEQAALITYKAHIADLKGEYKNALKYNLQALDLREKTGHRSSTCASLLNIGGNYTLLGDYEQAHAYLQKGLEMAKDQNIISLGYAYEKLSSLFKLEGNYEKALDYTVLGEIYIDSIRNNRTNEEILFFKNQYQLERERTISEQLKLERKVNEVIFLIIVIVLAVLAIILLSRLNYLRKKSTKEIVKLSNIIETTTQAVFIANSKSKIEYVNNGLVSMLGFSQKSDLAGRSIFELTNNEGKKLINNEILPALLTIGHWKGEINNMKKDGSFIICEEICSVISSKEGKPELYIAIFNDITKRKESEVELKTSRENLEKTVKTKDKMFSIIAHDLTGPFSSILGLSELMINDYDKYQKDAHIRFCQLIYNSSKHTFELLTNLLHWSRSQLDNIELAKENINLNELVFNNAELLKLMMDNKEITLQNNVSSDKTAYIDNSTISIVIRNLLSNAIKFTARGGTIKVEATEKDSKVNLIISDTGIGINEQDLSELFKINKNVSRKGTENERGTGLGLILCKEFTELNNGQISIESEVGKGSKFTISLPIS